MIEKLATVPNVTNILINCCLFRFSFKKAKQNKNNVIMEDSPKNYYYIGHTSNCGFNQGYRSNFEI